ncbi:MAG: pilus assembly protein PilP [Pseudomonadota bacterium]
MTRQNANPGFSRNASIGLTVLAAALLAGCQEHSMADLHQYVQERRHAHAGYVEPLPEFELSRGIFYSSEGIRDPFVRPVRYTAIENNDFSGSNAPDFDRYREPLEGFALDALAMVGDLKQNENHWGLIRDAEGVIHRVQPGNYAGKNYGRILAIDETYIAIEETVRDSAGNWVTREAQLSLGE